MPVPLAVLILALEVSPPHIQAAKTTVAPVIDGRLDDSVWVNGQPTDAFTQGYPFDGARPSERTTMRVLYDDDALYVGFECEQIHSPILERLTRRDQDSESDWVYVMIDPRGEGKTALAFGVNVSGVLQDAIITDPNNWNSDWDETWEARATRTPTGWSAELRIPFRVLRFDSSLTLQNWGWQAGRYIAHKQEADFWAYIPRSVANPIARFGRLENLTGVKRSGKLELRPFVSADGRRLETTDETTASGYSAGGSVGLDLKWHIAQDLTLDGAIRPDFGQVEADQVVLNLTNYETFLPEKRPLFLEGTEVFSFPLQVFYSRRIGFAPDNPTLRSDTSQKLVNVPPPVTIDGAAKLVGRLGTNWTIGTIATVTAPNEVAVQDQNNGVTNLLVAPLTAYNVLRLKREWGATGHIGLIATGSTTFETNGGYPALPPGGLQLCPSGATPPVGSRCFRDSYLTGVDALWRSPLGDYIANGALIESVVHGGPPTIQLDGTSIGSGAHAAGGWLRFAKEGGTVLASAVYSGAGRYLDYNDLGFMPRQNLHELSTSVGYRTLQAGRFSIETNSALQVTERRSLAGLDLGQIYELNSRLRLRNFWSLFVAADLAPARFDDRELGNGVALERGGYVGAKVDLATDPKRAMVAALSTQALLIQKNAKALVALGTFTLSPAPQFTVSLIPQLTWSSGEPRYTSQTVPAASDPTRSDFLFGKLAATSLGITLRASYTFAPRLTLQAYAQAFLAAGHFSDLRAVSAVAGQRLQLDKLATAPALPGTPSPNPDFAQAALNLNVVLRWEFRLGSTLFFVYSRSQLPDISGFVGPASLQPQELGARASADVVLLKLSYWWSS